MRCPICHKVLVEQFSSSQMLGILYGYSLSESGSIDFFDNCRKKAFFCLFLRIIMEGPTLDKTYPVQAWLVPACFFIVRLFYYFRVIHPLCLTQSISQQKQFSHDRDTCDL